MKYTFKKRQGIFCSRRELASTLGSVPVTGVQNPSVDQACECSVSVGKCLIFAHVDIAV